MAHIEKTRNHGHSGRGAKISDEGHIKPRYEVFWFCHLCHDGPNSVAGGLQKCVSVSCQHIRCSYCHVEQYKIFPELGDPAAKGSKGRAGENSKKTSSDTHRAETIAGAQDVKGEYQSAKRESEAYDQRSNCTECIRRKQKCNKKQPCSQCVRRYPPPKCVYNINENSNEQEGGVEFGLLKSDINLETVHSSEDNNLSFSMTGSEHKKSAFPIYEHGHLPFSKMAKDFVGETVFEDDKIIEPSKGLLTGSLKGCIPKFAKATYFVRQNGKLRIRWKCKCGQQIWDDFEVLPGVMKSLLREQVHFYDKNESWKIKWLLEVFLLLGISLFIVSLDFIAFEYFAEKNKEQKTTALLTVRSLISTFGCLILLLRLYFRYKRVMDTKDEIEINATIIDSDTSSIYNQSSQNLPPELDHRNSGDGQFQHMPYTRNECARGTSISDKVSRILSRRADSIQSVVSSSSGNSQEMELPLHEQQTPGPMGHRISRSQAPPSPAADLLFLLLCYSEGRYATRLLQLDLVSLEAASSDRELFQILHELYFSIRGKWLSFFSLRTLAWIKFVAFEMHPGELIDVRKVNDIPPPEHRDYKYVPAPPDVIPPVGDNHLMHLFHNPACATDNPLCLSRFPKKLKQRLLCNGGINPGWGLQFVESWDAKKIWLLAFVFFGVGSLLFGVLWAVFEHGIQDAFAIAGYMVAFATVSVGSLQALLVM